MLRDFVHILIARESDNDVPILDLFGGPFVSYGRQRVAVPEGSKRLLVFVALHRGRVERRYAARTLWPVGDGIRVAGNLRQPSGVSMASVSACCDDLRLVDLHVVGAWAIRLIRGSASDADLGMIPSGVDAIDLLPAGMTTGR